MAVYVILVGDSLMAQSVYRSGMLCLIRPSRHVTVMRMVNTRTGHVIRSAVAVLLMVSASAQLLGDDSQSTRRKPYALSDGMDLQARKDGGLFPIVGFSKKRIVITRNGTRDPLSTKSEISYALRRKMSSKWVDMKIVETESFNYELQAQLAAYSNALSQLDRNENLEAGGRIDVGENGIEGRNHDGRQVTPGPLAIGMNGQRPPEEYKLLIKELEDKLFNPDVLANALRVVLDLETKVPTKGVYLVLIARVDSPATEPDSRPLIQVVGQLEPDKKRTVKAVFKDLPAGFSLLDLDIHIYSRGDEIPWEGSSGLKMLSEDEAFEYSLGRYKDSKGKVEPVLFRPLPSAAITSFLSEKEILEIQAELFVYPDGSARVSSINTDDRPLSDKLAGILEDVRFIPAIEDGEPTLSTVSLKLSSLIY